MLESVGDVELLPKFLDAASRSSVGPSESAMASLQKSAGLEPLFV